MSRVGGIIITLIETLSDVALIVTDIKAGKCSLRIKLYLNDSVIYYIECEARILKCKILFTHTYYMIRMECMFE